MTRIVKLPVGATYQCKPIFLDQNNRLLSPQPASSTVSYASDTTAAATVDSTGLVTAVAVGTANITATSGSLTATLQIQVYTPVPTTLSM